MLTLSLLWKKLKLSIDDIIRPKTYKSALSWFIVSLTLTIGFLIYGYHACMLYAFYMGG